MISYTAVTSRLTTSLLYVKLDLLRMAVKEIICDNGNERRQYEEALIAITVEESLKQ